MLMVNNPLGNYALTSDITNLQTQVTDLNTTVSNITSEIFVTPSQYTNTKSQPAGSSSLVTITFPWTNYTTSPLSGYYNVTVDRIATFSGLPSTTLNIVLGTVKISSNTYNTLNVTYLWTQTTGLTQVTTGAKSFTISGTSLALTYDAALTIGFTYQFKLTLTPISDVCVDGSLVVKNTTNLSGGLIAVDTTFTAADLKSKLMGEYMTRGGAQTLTSNITASSDTYTFMGAKPSEIALLNGVTSGVQAQINTINSVTGDVQDQINTISGQIQTPFLELSTTKCSYLQQHIQIPKLSWVSASSFTITFPWINYVNNPITG
jgi:hypothetical protein